MKVLIAVLSIIGVALASLEPAGYRAPGSSSTFSQYLPPDQQSHEESPSSSQYLPPNQNRPSNPGRPSSQYLPPRVPQESPVTNYLPASDKPRPSLSPNNDYLPPTTPIKQQPSPPSSEYLPPLARSQTTRAPVKSSYLSPKSEYLPPSAGTPVPRISVLSVSPYKLDGPAYSKSSNFGGLTTSATSAPTRSNAYPTPAPGIKSFEQPADNYLPPVTQSSEAYHGSNAGYRYGDANAAAGRVEQTTQAAKYDFEYRVSDEFGNDYVHKESRKGSQTQGFYSVLLPDGRKQIVHYEADENGFKPRISYEEAASVLGSKTPALSADAGFAGYDHNANNIDSPY